MQPITRATLKEFCIVCSQVLKITDDANQQSKQHYDLKDDPQLSRVFNSMAGGNQLQGKTTNIEMPTQLCRSCYTKVSMFCKFAELSICSQVALSELREDLSESREHAHLDKICATCFKMKQNQNVSSVLNESELQDLLGLIFIGIDGIEENVKRVDSNNICELCTQKCKTFLEFKRRLLESIEYLINVLSKSGTAEFSDEKTESHVELYNEHEYSEDTDLKDIIPSEDILHGLPASPFYRCEGCQRSFRKSNSLATHKCRAASSEELNNCLPDTFHCKICLKEYKSESLLRSHSIRVHCKANNMCPYCQREFKQKHHLKDHVRTVHENIRPYKCDYCDKCFGLPKTLRIHLMGHTNERPFQCDICEKTFRQRAELKRHLNNHSAGMRYRCPVCSQCKSSQDELDEHLTRHNNRDGYQCSKCGRKFTKLCHLKNHDDAVHLKLRPFKCEYDNCGKSFAARKTLLAHQQTHSGDGLNICEICSKQFNCKANLLRHLYMHKTNIKHETVE